MARSNKATGQAIVAGSQAVAGAILLAGGGAPLAAVVGLGGIFLGATRATRVPASGISTEGYDNGGYVPDNYVDPRTPNDTYGW